MKYPAYPKYKDSGVEWLGDVPECWSIKRLGHISSQKTNSFVDGPFGSDLKSEEYQDNGVPLIQLNNIKEGQHILQNMKFISEAKKIQLIRHIAIPGDVVIAKMAAPVARGTIVNKQYSEYVIVADCVKMTPDRLKVDSSYLIYALNSKDVRTGAELVSTGSTRIRINLTELKKLWIPYPPLAIQSAIANFLDRETTRIDALIKEKEGFIDLLKEKRQALISHAVTKGLDPTVAMKDSCVDWLGEVPQHWDIKPIKYFIRNIESGTSVNAADTPATENEIGVLKTSCVYSGRFNPTENKTVIGKEIGLVSCPLKVGTLIVSRMNTPDLVGAAGLVTIAPNNIYLPDRLWQVSFSNASPVFVYYWTQSALYRAVIKTVCTGTSSSMQNLSQEQFRSFLIVSPDYAEQTAIANYLDQQTAKIDALVAETVQSIELLKEHRTALISAAVTGKIDVRTAA